MPSSASIVYSAGPNSTANPETSGATNVSAMIEMVAPTKEPTAEMPSATPARPCRAIS